MEPLITDPEKLRAVAERIQGIIKIGWTYTDIARHIGVSSDLVRNIGGGGSVRRAVYDALMATTEEALLAGRPKFVPVRYIREKVGTLAAAGWPLSIQARRIGATEGALQRAVAGRAKSRITYDAYERVQQMWEELKDTPGPSVYARAKAERYGFSSPIGPERYRTDLEDRLEQRTRNADLFLRILTRRVRFGQPVSMITRYLGVSDDLVQDVVIKAGVRLYPNQSVPLGVRQLSHVVPEYRDRAREIIQVLREWDAAPGDVDPWPYAVRCGLMTAPMWSTIGKRSGDDKVAA